MLCISRLVRHHRHQRSDRTFTAQLPNKKPAPLVIVLHGNTQTGADMATRTSWPQVAKRDGFGVIFPDGLNHAWADFRPNSNRAGRAPPEGTDDVAFIVRLIEKLIADGTPIRGTSISPAFPMAAP